MLTRREFLEAGPTAGTAIALAPYGCAGERSAPGVVVNDIHSQLNSTRVHRVVKPPSVDAVVQLVQSARQEGRPLSIAGGRHAMGGQQFGSETTLVDMGSMNRVLGFDAARGLIDVEAGIQWPELMRHLVDAQQGAAQQWGIRQKQTGADRLSIGRTAAACCSSPSSGTSSRSCWSTPTGSPAPAVARRTPSCFDSRSAGTGCSAWSPPSGCGSRRE